MKKFTLIAALALLTCTTANAQFTNTSGTSNGFKGSGSTLGTLTDVKSDGWTTMYFQYNPSQFRVKDADDSPFTFHGITYGFSRAIGLTKAVPLYLEVGGNLRFSLTNNFLDLDDYKWKMLTIGVPVNLIYCWNVTDKFAIAPYFGFHFDVHVWGNFKYGDADALNIFDDDDMKTRSWDLTHKRFQAGWQIGANFMFGNKVSIGAGYGTEFNELLEQVKTSRAYINLGIIL